MLYDYGCMLNLVGIVDVFEVCFDESCKIVYVEVMFVVKLLDE